MNSKSTIFWCLMISLGLSSCASQQESAAPQRAQAGKEQPPASARAPAPAQEAKQPQGPGIVKAQAGAPYMSGGIGVDERNRMRQAAKDYNLSLAFAGKSRGYLTDVSVVVNDDKGKQVFSAANTGPWLYVQLPPGSYTVKATYSGKVREVKNLRVKKDGALRQTIFWDID